MISIYPKDLQTNDKIRIYDPETRKVWWERVDSITVDLTNEEKNVMVFTDARTIMCDPGLKVQVQREAEQSVGE